ncbi:MAG: hypothetical protein D6695_04480 [Planctomycetota bacterium]|nr:MAG: hypothetical protein D6695_04480 [Planctomycetota bacterium]
MGVPLRVIQVVRNRFDAITTNTRKSTQLKNNLGRGVDQFIRLAEAAERVRARLAESEIIIVRHEELVADVHTTLTNVCSRLGVEASGEYLDACSSIAFESPRRTRDAMPWTPVLRAKVEARIASDPLLACYTFDS